MSKWFGVGTLFRRCARASVFTSCAAGWLACAGGCSWNGPSDATAEAGVAQSVAGAGGASAGAGTGASAGATSGASGGGAGGVTGMNFHWTSSGPLMGPIADATHPIVSVKDPSIVFANGEYHVFATTPNTSGNWSIIYTHFADFPDAASAPQYYFDLNPVLRGYHAAPQVFFFRPQNKWYLIFQSGQPQYTTADDLSKPETWAQPKNFFYSEPMTVKANRGSGDWLDFFVICDDAQCHLFFCDDNGEFYRSDTDITSFPMGFAEPVVAMQDSKENLFEGDAVYRIKGQNKYLAMIEAFGPSSDRYYRAFVADSLTGSWTPLAASWQQPFASVDNVTFDGGSAWTQDISHGELLRDGFDETLTVDLAHLRFLYQGVDPAQRGLEYSQLPYRLGLLTATAN